MVSQHAFNPGEIEVMHQHRGWFIRFGLMLMLLGVLSAGLSLATDLAINVLIGWLLIIGGVIQVFHALGVRRSGGFFLELLSGLVYFGAGALTLLYPLTGVISLALVLSTFFVTIGLLKMLAASRLRPLPNWWHLFADGVLAMVSGFLVLVGWPSPAAWGIGSLFGINLLSRGYSLGMFARAFRQVTFRENLICVGEKCFAH